ncbi:NAD(P)/FAD-dependent oxidoreductase [Nocardioides sp.]|uniref:flavin monoamine oxidase family protein n=1 Tax=Nocardioides sp. TaxID=35761 RepID=UPI002B276661|nr:NAD(P)/FAD-dependent oxidoreductase [Nocardioides sp.]
MDADVVVIGAGLAGLRCATELVSAGHEVVVLEAGDDIGGRIRTERIDGYQVDRGFQLLNPAYPAVRRWVDANSLRLGTFEAGVAALTDERLIRLGHPLRAPRLLAATLRGVGGELGDVPALLRWLRPLAHRSDVTHLQALSRRTDLTLAASLDAAGVSGTLRRVLERFFAGVLLDDSGTSSAAYARLLTATFLSGNPGLPAAGMQALPRQVAAPLKGRIRTSTPVHEVGPTPGSSGFRVRTDDGDLVARRVVVATGQQAAAALIALPEERAHGVVTQWWSTTVEPTRHRVLHVDARSRPTGPLVNTAVVSHAAPTYAPAGRHLVQASALMGPGRPTPREPAMRRHAAELLRADGFAEWQVVTRHEIPRALPVQSAPLDVARPLVLPDGLVVCGDHRDTACIQGALVSGHRAAQQVGALLSGASG